MLLHNQGRYMEARGGTDYQIGVDLFLIHSSLHLAVADPGMGNKRGYLGRLSSLLYTVLRILILLYTFLGGFYRVILMTNIENAVM